MARSCAAQQSAAPGGAGASLRRIHVGCGGTIASGERAQIARGAAASPSWVGAPSRRRALRLSARSLGRRRHPVAVRLKEAARECMGPALASQSSGRRRTLGTCRPSEPPIAAPIDNGRRQWQNRLETMTGAYEWNPMPHIVDIRCPRCGERCSFEFAEVVKIELKRDVPFFKKSRFFEYRFFRGGSGQSFHGALFYPGLNAKTAAAAEPLPAGYCPEDWAHSKYLYRSHGLDVGTADCGKCGLREKHALEWPAEAWYKIAYRGRVLWAFHRESVLELRAYIASEDRERDQYKWRSFLQHVPSAFLTKGARGSVLKQLDRLIGARTTRSRSRSHAGAQRRVASRKAS